MPDQGDDPRDDFGERDDSRDDSDGGFESEHTATRAEAAAVLRGLADGVDAGVVALSRGRRALTGG